MTVSKIGFIGCGNMGGALATAVSKRGLGECLVLCDASAQKADVLANGIGGRVETLKSLASTCDFIFLGVKPQGFEQLFGELRPILQVRREPFVLVSMAAGLSIAKIEALAACDCAVIRIMPNTPVSVGAGMILYASNEKTTKEQLDVFCQILKGAGQLDPIPEEKIDAASALSGCGPAFVYLFAEALADGAVECGLPRDKAMLYVAQTLLGAATLLKESGKHPGELKDAVCSPGGTTIAGVHALEASGFRAAAMSAVTAAYEKTLKLKQ